MMEFKNGLICYKEEILKLNNLKTMIRKFYSEVLKILDF